MYSLEAKRVLLMGGGQNIGREIAFALARAGADVVVADINVKGAEQTARSVREMRSSARGLGIYCDVGDDASVTQTVEAARDFLGAIDVLVNNVGIIHLGNPEDFPIDEWLRMFNVNLMGGVRANALVLPEMIGRGEGYIVHTASFAGLFPYATNRIPYAASKAAVISMSETLAIYLRPLGVRVACLCPGPTMTTSTQGLTPWSEQVVHRGPGSDLVVLSQAEVADILIRGIEAEQTIIYTHEDGFKDTALRGANPNAYIEAKLAAFSAGDNGLPSRVSDKITRA